MRQPPFEDILEVCLQAVLGRGESLEQVLSRYPEQAARLQPLLETALAVRRVSAPEPGPQARSLARQRLARALAGPRPRPTWAWRWAAAPLAILLVLLLGGTGTVLAASDSTPGAVLYPVKTATERLRVAFTRGEVPRARLELRLAEERVKELEAVGEEGRSERIAKLTERLEKHLERFRDLVPAADEATLAELASLMAEREAGQQARLEALLAQASPQVRAALAQALVQARLHYAQSWQDLEGLMPPPQEHPALPLGHPPVFWMGMVEKTEEGQIIVRGQAVRLGPGGGDFRPGQRVLIRGQLQPDGSFQVLEVRRLGPTEKQR